MNENNILKDIQQKAGIWKNLENENITLKRMHALTNTVYRVKVAENAKIKDGQPRAVIYKEFNKREGVKALIDRKQETLIFQASSDAKLGPHLYFVDEHIRIDEFLEAQEFVYKDMIDSKRQIVLMQTISNFHKLKPKIESEDIFKKLVVSGKMMQMVEKKIKETPFNVLELKLIKKITKFVEKDKMEILYKEMQKDDGPKALCHNDLLNGNIMKYREKFSKLTLIDYEYSGFNFRGYDIANFCNESMIDYSMEGAPGFVINKGNLPKDFRLRDIYKHYIYFSRYTQDKDYNLNEILLNHALFEENWSKDSVLEEELQILLNLHNYYMIASHIVWILWAIISSKGVNADFDYLEFARQRFEIARELAGEFTLCNLL